MGMILIGHRITKIQGERHDIKGSSTLKNISSNAVPANIREGKSLDPKKKVLIVEWEFKSEYELEDDKNLAELVVGGEVVYEMEAKEFKKVLNSWKKTKKLKKEQLLPMLQNILNIAQVYGIILAKDLNLPSPVQLIRIKDTE
jgi:hypothetical protein